MEVIERYPLSVRLLQGKGLLKLLFPIRAAMAFLYGVGVWFVERKSVVSKTRKRRHSIKERDAKIISVGNIEVGGSGKTPCAIALCEAIRSRGGRPVVVSRGYRGSFEGRGSHALVKENSVEDGGKMENTRVIAEIAERFGDEAALYWLRNIPLVIDADRLRGTEHAVAHLSATHVILDDAFQCFSLEKDLDILLLDGERPFDNGFLLPAGRLREKPCAVRRADVVIFTRSSRASIPPEARSYVAGKPVFFARYEATSLRRADWERRDISSISEKEAIVFSGLAKPEYFESLIAQVAGSLKLSFRFEDHHRYEANEIISIIRSGNEQTVFVTTMKDLVKAAFLVPRGFEVYALEIRMEIESLESLLTLACPG